MERPFYWQLPGQILGSTKNLHLKIRFTECCKTQKPLLCSQHLTICSLLGSFLTSHSTVFYRRTIKIDWTWNLYTSHQKASCPKRLGETRLPHSWEKIRSSIPSQTVSSFIKDTFHKQSWYFRQDMGRQSLTVYNNFQTPFFNGLPKSESHYKTQWSLHVMLWTGKV